jgi:hypothetical protein
VLAQVARAVTFCDTQVTLVDGAVHVQSLCLEYLLHIRFPQWRGLVRNYGVDELGRTELLRLSGGAAQSARLIDLASARKLAQMLQLEAEFSASLPPNVLVM